MLCGSSPAATLLPLFASSFAPTLLLVPYPPSLHPPTHPCAGLLTEIINSRLFTTVRDTLGLTYDVSFELSLFDRLPSGWFHVNVTSTPQKIREAMMASLRCVVGRCGAGWGMPCLGAKLQGYARLRLG